VCTFLDILLCQVLACRSWLPALDVLKALFWGCCALCFSAEFNQMSSDMVYCTAL